MTSQAGTRHRKTLGRSLVIPVMLWCSCAHAQTVAGTTAEDVRLEEVVVTAERREADLQRTAVAVSAFNQPMLDHLDVRELGDLQKFVPSLVFSQDNSEFKVAIRGVGSDDVGLTSQPGVALHLDGVFIGRASGFNAATYDIERIEVLRGPQGTLYGRNSTGGTINVLSQPPDYELSAIGDIRVGSYDELRFRGAVNVPLFKDKAAARLTFVSEDRDGYETNLYPGGTQGSDADNTYWRLQFLFEPVDTLSIMLRASQFESRGVGPGRKRLPTPTDSPTQGATQPTEDPDPYTVWKDTPEQQSVDMDLYSIQADWELPFATLTALASSAETDFDWIADGDQTRGQATDPGGFDFIAGASIPSEQKLGELRLTSLPSGRFDWLLGAFYLNEEVTQDFRLTNAVPATGPFTGLIDNTAITSITHVDTTSYAGFGQISYSFGADEQFKLIAGARYTHDEGEGELSDQVDISIDPVFALSFPSEETLSETWSKTTWNLGADWQLTPDSLLYASISTGFRAGGFNFGAPSPEEALYDPEDLLAFEIGSKNRFLDERLQLNLAAFYYDYEDFQVFQIADFSLFIENAAEVSNYGIEAELTALATSAFEIDAHISYQHGRFETFLSGDPLYPFGPDGSPNSGDELYDLSGNHLPNNPDFSGHLGGQYTWGISSLGSLTLRGQTYYQTEVYSRGFNLAVGRQDSYTQSSLQARFDAGNEHWYLVAGVNNIEDEAVVANIAISGGGHILVNVGPPRTWYGGFGFQF